MTAFLIIVSALATWLGLCAVIFRAPSFIATVADFIATGRHFIHHPGGRHAR